MALQMFDPSIPGGFKTPPIGGLEGEFGAIGGGGGLSALGYAMLPIAGVNLAASLFGRESRFPKKYASDIANIVNPLMKRQMGILEKAGGKGSDIYRELAGARKQLSGLTGSGDIEGILGLQQGLASLTGRAQDIISPIPKDFIYDMRLYDPSLNIRAPHPRAKNPFHGRMSSYLGISQYLNKLEGIGKPGAELTGERVRPGTKAATRTLGQGYYIDLPELKAPTRSMGRGRAQQRMIKQARGKQFISIDPLDYGALKGRLRTTAPEISETSQRQGIDKKQIGKVAVNVAKNFLRFPRLPGREPREFRSSGFVSRAGYRDISELEQDVDRIIPSGFISKQPTTQSRALALRSLS